MKHYCFVHWLLHVSDIENLEYSKIQYMYIHGSGRGGLQLKWSPSSSPIHPHIHAGNSGIEECHKCKSELEDRSCEFPLFHSYSRYMQPLNSPINGGKVSTG